MYYMYNSGLIDILSLLLTGYLIYLGVSNYQLKKKIDDLEGEMRIMKLRIIRQSKKTDVQDEEEEFEFMRNKL